MAIPITKPYFGAEELEAIQAPLQSGWVVQGPFVKKFEDKFSAYTGSPHSIATTSCTTALHIAVAVLGLKPGDEVIVPSFTWVSTANVVEYMGATPVFCDIELDTLNIDVGRIEQLITPRTVGIIPVHLFGLCADMDPIMNIAHSHGLWVIEDAACALGASYRGSHAGTFGDFGCFSFHPRKSITTGEGGMITTASEDRDEISRSLRDHGASRTDLERHAGKLSFLLSEYDMLGYNFRMTDIQGALGAVQMDRLEWILSERRRLAKRYDDMLAEVHWLDVPVEPEGYRHGYQAYVCVFKPEEPTLENTDAIHDMRNQLMERLEDRGIATRQGTHAPVIQKYYAKKYGYRPADFPVAYMADKLTLTLPLFPQMTDDEQEEVVHELLRAFEGLRA